MLRSDDLPDFLQVMYGNEPSQWRDDLSGHDRLRFIINVLTRMRFCTADGAAGPEDQGRRRRRPPKATCPWFDVPGRRTAGVPIAFGHWSTLGLIERTDLLALDTGCVWGGALTAVRVDGGRREVVQVHCARGAERRVEPGIGELEFAPCLRKRGRVV